MSLISKSGCRVFQSHMQPVEFCESYPVLNYSLEINATSSKVVISAQDRATLAAESIIISGNLSENAAYSFRILTSNSVGTVASNRTHFCKLRDANN